MRKHGHEFVLAPIRFPQLSLALAQRLFRLLAFGDVVEHLHDAEQGRILCAKWRTDDKFVPGSFGVIPSDLGFDPARALCNAHKRASRGVAFAAG